MMLHTVLLGTALAVAISLPAQAAPDAERHYTEHCAACHGADRLGAIGPALLPQNLGRMKPAQAIDIITHGRIATQMPAFSDKLDTPAIEALAQWVFTEPAEKPAWGADQIATSHILHVDPATLPAEPQHGRDPMNLFTVVESGDHHVSVLDGDSFEVIARFPSRFALHGGVKYSPDGRFAYMASRDGWVSQYDLHTLQPVAEVRAGINTRNIAVSGDGKWIAVGNMVPASVVILDARALALHKVIPVIGDFGKESRVSAVYAAPPRESFIVALKDIPEVWEIPTVTPKKPYYPGYVHSYQTGMVEALGVQDTAFSVRRIKLDDYLDDFFFDQTYTHLIGAARNGLNGQVVHLTVGRKIAEVALSGMPHLGSGITWKRGGRSVLATPHLKGNQVSVIDLETWETVKTIETLGPGFFMRSHSTSPYAWTDVFFGPHRDKVHIIDKQTLEIVKTLQPVPGKTAAHIEFTADGRFALLSIMEADGALIVYDAATLEEIKRLPMKRPVGKYNVGNKIRYEEGTSH